MNLPGRRTVQYGVQALAAGLGLPRHQHAASYLTLVLEGAYEQIGYAGRLRPQAGDVLVQPTLDCHANTMRTRGLTLMRLPWRHEPGLGGVWRGLDVDAIRRVGETDPGAASEMVALAIRGRPPLVPVVDHWIDLLASALVADPRQRIGAWSAASGRSREAVSRAFHAQYGVSPARLRTELRAREAWARVVASDDPLAAIALDLGFADQSHMTRAVRWLTAASPGQWRRQRASAFTR